LKGLRGRLHIVWRSRILIGVRRGRSVIFVPKFASLDHDRQIAFAQERIGEGVGFVAEDVALLDVAGFAGLALDRVADGFVEAFVEFADEEGPAGLAQGDAAGDGLEEVLLGAAAGEEEDGGSVPENAEGLDQVEDQ
jgi:hypothetical protein